MVATRPGKIQWSRISENAGKSGKLKRCEKTRCRRAFKKEHPSVDSIGLEKNGNSVSESWEISKSSYVITVSFYPDFSFLALSVASVSISICVRSKP